MQQNIICAECNLQSSYYCDRCIGYFCDNHLESHLKIKICSNCKKESCKDIMDYAQHNIKDAIDNDNNVCICFNCYVNLANNYIQTTSKDILNKTMDIDGDDTINLVNLVSKFSNIINNGINK